MSKLYILFLALLVFWQLPDVRASSSYICDDDSFDYEGEGTLDKCLADCEDECENGQCENEVCICNEHFELKNGKCESLRNETCLETAERNGTSCVCQAGFSGENGVCFPECSEDLGPHRYCVAPGTALCMPGYTEVGGDCKPLCEPACDRNATCIAPNTCRCEEGLQREDDLYIVLIVIAVLSAMLISQLCLAIWIYVHHRKPAIEIEVVFAKNN